MRRALLALVLLPAPALAHEGVVIFPAGDRDAQVSQNNQSCEAHAEPFAGWEREYGELYCCRPWNGELDSCVAWLTGEVRWDDWPTREDVREHLEEHR